MAITSSHTGNNTPSPTQYRHSPTTSGYSHTSPSKEAFAWFILPGHHRLTSPFNQQKHSSLSSMPTCNPLYPTTTFYG
ncbi:hypothetical protein [Spirosoma validum]|uniref:Uncharacterized protein n=1 Tax=Spirosoma validum TaxID=2771355 RepID=A0A927AY07_9BACT|nr:hypothetical protein [Spirosoma validum]MBD2751926.1 hypothetical protein [Spirosoma validum]